MKLLKNKVWTFVDIILLKWCCLIIGMILGAYLMHFTIHHLWFFVVGAVLLAIKPAISYFSDEKR